MRASCEGVSCQAGSGTVSAHALRLAREAFYFTFSSDETFRLFRLGKQVEILTILHYLLNKNSVMRLFGLRPVSGLRGQRGLANASPEHRKHLHWTCTNQTKNVQPLAAVAVVFVNPGARWRLANTINRQRAEAAVCCENIEATIGVAGDEDAAVVEFVS